MFGGERDGYTQRESMDDSVRLKAGRMVWKITGSVSKDTPGVFPVLGGVELRRAMMQSKYCAFKDGKFERGVWCNRPDLPVDDNRMCLEWVEH